MKQQNGNHRGGWKGVRSIRIWHKIKPRTPSSSPSARLPPSPTMAGHWRFVLGEKLNQSGSRSQSTRQGKDIYWKMKINGWLLLNQETTVTPLNLKNSQLNRGQEDTSGLSSGKIQWSQKKMTVWGEKFLYPLRFSDWAYEVKLTADRLTREKQSLLTLASSIHVEELDDVQPRGVMRTWVFCGFLTKQCKFEEKRQDKGKWAEAFRGRKANVWKKVKYMGEANGR